MKIPFVDLKAQYQTISSEIDQAIKEVIQETAFIGGKHVKVFEEGFANYCQAKYCIGVGNGTDALFIALKACKIGSGDEVIVPANTFIATAEAVTATGAKVVFIDVEPATYNIDLSRLEKKITPRTKAVIPVHLYGQPADLDTLVEIARGHGIKIIQDCAQAHGAGVNGKPLADYGDILCYSFYPGKNLGAYGDAGAIISNDEQIATWCRMVANHGRLTKFDHEIEGVNSRLDGLQAAILNVKLKYLDGWIESRRRNAALYDALLQDVPGVVVPHAVPERRHVYHLYVIRVAQREALKAYLHEQNIATGIHYPVALPNLTAYQYLGHVPDDFPIASRYQNEILSLPMYPELTPEMVGYVAEEIKSFQRKSAP